MVRPKRRWILRYWGSEPNAALVANGLAHHRHPSWGGNSNLALDVVCLPDKVTSMKEQNNDSCLIRAALQSASRSVFSTRNVTFLFLIGLFTTGCISPKSYVDPQFRRATFADVKPSDTPKPVIVEVSFQVNGKNKPSVDEYVRIRVMKVLQASKVFAAGNMNLQTNISHLKIVVNNIADLGEARAKGFATGFTFGAAGSDVVDNYEMTAVYTPADGSPITKTYKHALHTTFGAHSAPPGLEPVPRELAFDQIMEDMLLNFLSDLQKQGVI